MGGHVDGFVGEVRGAGEFLVVVSWGGWGLLGGKRRLVGKRERGGGGGGWYVLRRGRRDGVR